MCIPPTCATFRFPPPLEVLGQPVTPRYASSSYSGPNGYQLSLRSSAPLSIYGYEVDTNEPEVVVVPPPSPSRRVCVPLTERYVVNSSNFENEVSEFNIRRTTPINCATFMSATFSHPEAQVVLDDGHCCGGTQLLNWPPGVDTGTPPTSSSTLQERCSYANNAATSSTLSTYSRWYAHSAVPSSNPLFLFRNTLDDGVCNPGDECGIALDRTAFIPCTGVARNTWFTCLNPIMSQLYPEYPPSDPSIPTTPFVRPMNLFTTRNDPPAIRGPTFRWTQFATMTHYCAKFNTGKSANDSTGWVQNGGNFVGCNNDPMTLGERQDFCATKKPWLVLTGNVLETLELRDVCPF